jgi:flagellar basal body-associated protein FliL
MKNFSLNTFLITLVVSFIVASVIFRFWLDSATKKATKTTEGKDDKGEFSESFNANFLGKKLLVLPSGKVRAVVSVN